MSTTPKDTKIITYIYTLSDPVTNEIKYVGKTVKELKSRLTDHIYRATKNKERNYRTNWINSLIKQDLIPKIELIDSCIWSNSQALEIFYIRNFKEKGFKLVNSTEGGEGNLGLKFSEERLQKHRESLRKNSKKVYQYTLEGEFVKEWINAKEAGESGYSYGMIIRCCIGDRKIHKNFQWSYLKQENISPALLPNRKLTKEKCQKRSEDYLIKYAKKFEVYLPTGEYVGEWKNISTCSKDLKISRSLIINILKNKVKCLPRRYVFIYSEEKHLLQLRIENLKRNLQAKHEKNKKQ